MTSETPSSSARCMSASRLVRRMVASRLRSMPVTGCCRISAYDVGGGGHPCVAIPARRGRGAGMLHANNAGRIERGRRSVFLGVAQPFDFGGWTVSGTTPSLRSRSPGLTLQFAANDHLAISINAMHLKNRLRNIQTDCLNCLHDWLL